MISLSVIWSKFAALHEELEAIDAIKVTAPEELKYMFKDVTVGRDPLVDDKDSNKEMRWLVTKSAYFLNISIQCNVLQTYC